MKVYLVYDNDDWEETSELVGVYGTKEKAVKCAAELILKRWDDFMNCELKLYNDTFNTNQTREWFAMYAASNNTYDSWKEVEVL